MKFLVLLSLVLIFKFLVPETDASYKFGTKTLSQTIPDGSTTLLSWQTSDNSNDWISFNVPVAGTYYVHLSCCLQTWGGTVTTKIMLRSLILNKTLKIWTDYSESPSTQTIDVSGVIKVSQTDINKNIDFSWYILQNSGKSKDIVSDILVDGTKIKSTFYEFYLLNL